MTFLVLVARSGPSHLRVVSCSTPSGCAPNMHLQNVAKLPLSYLGPLSRPTCPDGCGPADAIAAKVCRPLGLAKPCCTPPVCQNKPHLTVILRIVFFSFLFCFFGVELAPRIATSVKEVKSPWLSWLLHSSLSDTPLPPCTIFHSLSQLSQICRRHLRQSLHATLGLAQLPPPLTTEAGA